MKLQSVIVYSDPMINAFWRFLSDVCWMIGAEHWALKFLLMSMETVNVTAPVINLKNTLSGQVPQGPFDLKVIYEDKELLAQLGDLHTNYIVIPRSVLDVN